MKKLVTGHPPAQQQKFLQDNTATLDKTSFFWILSNTFSPPGFLFVGCQGFRVSVVVVWGRPFRVVIPPPPPRINK